MAEHQSKLASPTKAWEAHITDKIYGLSSIPTMGSNIMAWSCPATQVNICPQERMMGLWRHSPQQHLRLIGTHRQNTAKTTDLTSCQEPNLQVSLFQELKRRISINIGTASQSHIKVLLIRRYHCGGQKIHILPNTMVDIKNHIFCVCTAVHSSVATNTALCHKSNIPCPHRSRVIVFFMFFGRMEPTRVCLTTKNIYN